MKESIVWEIERSDKQGGFIERLWEVDDGIRYERISSEEQQAVFPDLRTEPFPDYATALAAVPEVLHVDRDDEVTECDLPDEVVVDYFLTDSDGWAETFDLAGRSWEWRSGFLMPCDVDPIDSWNNGDAYGAPGGDRTANLYRFGTLSLVDLDDRGITKLGHHRTEAEARSEWVEYYIPGGWEGYRAAQEEE